MTVRNIERGLWLVLFCWAFWFVVALFAASAARAQPIIDRPRSLGPVVVQLDGIPTGTLVTMLLRDVMRVPYVIAPDVLADKRPTSVRLIMPRDQVPERVVGYLRQAGFTVQLQGGAVNVTKAGGRFSSYGNPPAASVPYGSPVVLGREGFADPQPASLFPRQTNTETNNVNSPSAAPEPPVAETILAYVPAHRDPAYLSSVLGSVLPGLSFGARADARADPGNQTIRGENGPDTLVMAGTATDIARARRLIVLLDRARPMVAVKAVVLQASNIHQRGSALSILAKLGDGRLEVVSRPGGDIAASQFVRIAVGGVSAILSAVREDSNFRIVATPNLAALSGEVATINAGASVPTVGSVTFPEGGAPVQSVIYRDSGITLTVRPVVRGDLVELAVTQERSSFTKTATGVDNSPTLNKSSATASVTLKNGESLVLAGLTEATEGRTRDGLLGGLLGVRGREKSDSELLVVLTADIVPQPVGGPGQFFEMEEGPEAEASDPSMAG